MDFFDSLKRGVASVLLDTSISVHDEARATRLDSEALAPSVGLAGANAQTGVRGFHRQMLELRGRLPGLIASVLVPSGTHKSLVAYGQHEDDERDERRKRDFINRWLEELAHFGALSDQIRGQIAQGKDFIDAQIDRINDKIDRLDGQGRHRKKVAALKRQKQDLKDARHAYKEAERARRSAQDLQQLQNTQNTVNAVHAQVHQTVQQNQAQPQPAPQTGPRGWWGQHASAGGNTQSGSAAGTGGTTGGNAGGTASGGTGAGGQGGGSATGTQQGAAGNGTQNAPSSNP